MDILVLSLVAGLVVAGGIWMATRDTKSGGCLSLAAVGMIDVDRYPQLSLLAWNRVNRMVAPEEAFSLYERNWRLVWVADLTPEEKDLIRMLRQTVGKGVMRVQRGAYPLPPLAAREDTP